MSVMIATLRKSSRRLGWATRWRRPPNTNSLSAGPPFAVPALDDSLWRKRPARDLSPLGEGGDVGLFASEHPSEIPPPYPSAVPEEQEHIGHLHVAGYLFGRQRPVPVPAHCFPYRPRQLLVWQVEVLGVEAEGLVVAGRGD